MDSSVTPDPVLYPDDDGILSIGCPETGAVIKIFSPEGKLMYTRTASILLRISIRRYSRGTYKIKIFSLTGGILNLSAIIR